MTFNSWSRTTKLRIQAEFRPGGCAGNRDNRKPTEMHRLVGIHAEAADRVFKSRQEEKSPKRYKDRILLVCIL